MTTKNSTEANKALVLEGIKGVFIERDPTRSQGRTEAGPSA